ncbi:MAG: hypothetical protein M3Y50_03985, partial [Acidobacteriota bacterium]|nr:hypothetical protein [Acidobacteriota bacterium]
QEKLRNGSRVIPRQGPAGNAAVKSLGAGAGSGNVTGKAKDAVNTNAQRDQLRTAPAGNGGQRP